MITFWDPRTGMVFRQEDNMALYHTWDEADAQHFMALYVNKPEFYDHYEIGTWIDDAYFVKRPVAAKGYGAW